MKMLPAIFLQSVAALIPRRLRFRSYQHVGKEARRPPVVLARQEAIGQAFLAGVRAVVAQGANAGKVHRFIRESQSPWTRGFAVEGAAMAMGLLDRFCPVTEDKVASFLAGDGGRYRHLIEVGAGWAAALPWTMARPIPERGGLLLHSLRGDGFGFARALLRWRQEEVGQHLDECARNQGWNFAHVTAQGCGRAFWFLCGGSAPAIVASIAALPRTWQGDLWAGVGLAAVYAGGLAESELEQLVSDAEEYRGDLAQGAAFAAKARVLSEDLQPGDREREACDRACRTLAGCSMEAAARCTDEALEALPDDDGAGGAYEIWRHRIRRELLTRDGGWPGSHDRKTADIGGIS